MKKLYLLSVLATIWFSAFPQNYRPLLSDNQKKWVTYADAYLGNPYSFNVDSIVSKGDTSINAQIYKQYKVYQNAHSESLGWVSQSSWLFLRETLTQQVYQKTANSEYFLYDFSLELNDKFISYSDKNDTTNSLAFYWIVTAKDSILLDEVYYKRLTFTYQKTEWPDQSTTYDGEYTDIWIEGVGSIYGLPDIFWPGATGQLFANLLCMFENETSVYHNPNIYSGLNAITQDFFLDECMTLANAIHTTSHEDYTVQLARGVLYLQTPSHQLAHIQIYNSLGQVVYKDNIKEEAQIDLRTLGSQNVLIYRLNIEGQIAKTGKLIVTE